MKTLEKVVFPAALAMQATALPAIQVVERSHATKIQTEAGELRNFSSTSDDVVFDSALPAIASETVEIPILWEDDRWETCSKTYDTLVTKEALGTISRKELEELDRLQKIRRRLVAAPSGAEILARHRREKLDRDLIKLLKRHVRLQPIKNKA